ncbi:hypothetical protein GGR51DRAFT_520106 [Nemania sp. FL0031]|nr:hypothetical protein GGR51DRAFT_520106 [Nemania sp. FL0031]
MVGFSDSDSHWRIVCLFTVSSVRASTCSKRHVRQNSGRQPMRRGIGCLPRHVGETQGGGIGGIGGVVGICAFD